MLLTAENVLKNSRNIKKTAPVQNSLALHAVREGTSFADVTKPFSHCEIGNNISPASIQQSLNLSSENFPPLQNSNNVTILQSLSILNIDNLDININKLKEIETLLTNIINLAKNISVPTVPMFYK